MKLDAGGPSVPGDPLDPGLGPSPFVLDTAQARVIGALSTDDAGRFEGTAVVPRDLATGDYELLAVTGGDKQRCGAGRAD